MIKLLVVDDNESIHNDFKKVLQGKSKDKLRSVEMALFGDDDPDFELEEPVIEYDIHDAFQGEEAIEMVDKAFAEGNPYSMIFMDVRMPPGMDGIRAAAKIWEKHPEIELVICTAHSDYSWGEMVKEIGASDKLQFLRKPFDMVTVQQMALACVKKFESRERDIGELKDLRTQQAQQIQEKQAWKETSAQLNDKLQAALSTAGDIGEQANGFKSSQDPLAAKELCNSAQELQAHLEQMSQLLAQYRP